MKRVCNKKGADIDKLVSQNLRKKRLLSGKSTADVSKNIGVSVQQYAKYENGINRISSGMLYALSNAFDGDITDFYAYEDGVPYESKEPKNNNEYFNLVKAYSKIEDTNIRERLLQFIKGIS